MLAVTKRKVIFLINPGMDRHQKGESAVFFPQQMEGGLQQCFSQVMPPVCRVCRHAYNIRNALFLSPQ